MEVDNGQHVFMGCCTYYIDFLRAINAYDDAVLQDSLRAEVVLDDVRGTLSSSPALGPLHLVPSFIRYPHLGAGDKVRAVWGLLKASLTNRRKNVESLDSQTFYDWLRSNHQSERAIENLWNLIILPTLNDDVRSVNADMALMVVQQGLLKKPRDAAIGYARVGLGSIADVRGRRFIEDSGGSVIQGKTVRSLIFDGDVVGGARLSDGTTLQADAYVSALPYETLLDLLHPKLAADPFFEPIPGLTSAPIVNVHLWYDRQVDDRHFHRVSGKSHPVGLQPQPYPGKPRLFGPVRVHLPQRRVGLHQQAQARSRRNLRGGDETSVPSGPRRGSPKESDHQTTQRHVSVRPRVLPHVVHLRSPRLTTCSWQATGPVRTGPLRWRGLSEAESMPPAPCQRGFPLPSLVEPSSDALLNSP